MTVVKHKIDIVVALRLQEIEKWGVRKDRDVAS